MPYNGTPVPRMALLSRKGLRRDCCRHRRCALHSRAGPVSAKGLGRTARAAGAISSQSSRPWCGWDTESGDLAGAMSWPTSAAAHRRRHPARRRHHRGRQRPRRHGRLNVAPRGGDSGGWAGGAGVLDRTRPNQSRRTGAKGRGASGRHGLISESSLQHLAAIAGVHDLDSFGSIPLVRKVPMIRWR